MAKGAYSKRSSKPMLVGQATSIQYCKWQSEFLQSCKSLDQKFGDPCMGHGLQSLHSKLIVDGEAGERI